MWSYIVLWSYICLELHLYGATLFIQAELYERSCIVYKSSVIWSYIVYMSYYSDDIWSYIVYNSANSVNIWSFLIIFAIFFDFDVVDVICARVRHISL